MNKAKYTQNQHAILFDCPGCGYLHMVWVKQPEGGSYPIWEFNGDSENPTISPSILVNGNVPINPPHTHRCHSFVRDGKIQFLSDCTHSLAGQTVELPNIDA
ncbi:MAG: DUF6527 family protein [Phycisphaerales bacterium]